MKNFFLIFGLLLIVLGCSRENVDTIDFMQGPPINHAKPSANARDDCQNAYCAFRFPNAYYTLLGTYSKVQPGASVDVWWYISSNPNHFGYFPVATNPTLILTLRGPSTQGYPIVNSATVTNNSNASEVTSNGTIYYGKHANIGPPVGSPYGWYYYMLEYDAPDGSCRSSAVDIQVVQYL